MIRVAGLQVSRRALLAGLTGAIVIALAATSIVLVAARSGRSRPPVPVARTGAAALTADAAAAVVSNDGSPQTSAPAPTASASPTTSVGAPAVPWVNKPGNPQAPTVPASAGRPCHAADLDIAAGLSGAFQGLATQEVTLHDRAADSCFLSGAPQVVLTNAGARSRVSQGQFAARRLDLPSGSSADLVIGTPAGCGAGQPVVATSVLLTLPSGDAVTVGGTQIDTECGAPTLVQFGTADVLPAVTSGPLDSLEATVDAPDSVARGAVLTYQVTLANQSSASVKLASCPSYTQALGDVQQTLVLNCQAGTSIAANASVTYEMKLTVPASTPAGDTKLTWNLEVPNGPVTGAVITVT